MFRFRKTKRIIPQNEAYRFSVPFSPSLMLLQPPHEPPASYLEVHLANSIPRPFIPQDTTKSVQRCHHSESTIHYNKDLDLS